MIKEYLEKVDRASTELENKLSCKALLLMFHDKAMINRDVVDDLEFFIQEHIEHYINSDVCIVLHTFGGDADAAYHIGRRLQRMVNEKHRLIFIVPRCAKSAGTLLVCSGDEVYMTPIAELGPVDAQIFIRETGSWVSARVVRDSLKQVLETINELKIQTPDAVEAALRRIPIAELGHYNSLINHIKDL